MSILINGRALADTLLLELKNKIRELSFTPTLGVILIGDDEASHLYVNLKIKAAEEVGIKVDKKILPKTISENEVLQIINDFNFRIDINCILIQLPLPTPLDEDKIINAMSPEKDADGFHPTNLKLLADDKPYLIPGLVEGIIKLIEQPQVPLQNKTAALLVNSEIFANPLKKILGERGIICQILNQPNSTILRTADIIVSALGQPNIIKSEDIKDGAIVIDVGTTKVDGRLLGDVDAETLINRSIYLTPVPGGVWPMTVAILLWNVYNLATKK